MMETTPGVQTVENDLLTHQTGNRQSKKHREVIFYFYLTSNHDVFLILNFLKDSVNEKQHYEVFSNRNRRNMNVTQTSLLAANHSS